MTNHNMKQIHIQKYLVCIGLMLIFAGCASTKSAKCANGVFLPDSSFVCGKDTLCVKHTPYKECWTTKNYAKTAKIIREKGDTIPPYMWERIMYERVQYMGISDETRTMILSAGGVSGILHSCLSEQNYINTIRHNEIWLVADFVVSLADMKILEYGFELSWNDKNMQLSPKEIANILDLIHTIQLTYSGGEELKNEIIEVSMNLHNLR